MANSESESFVIIPDFSIEDFSLDHLMPQSEAQSLPNEDELISSNEYKLEDIESKLCELLNENQTLKETLRQNNLAMKQQVETLSKWQEDVFAVHQNHKIKFEETKELIHKLKTENIELNKKLRESIKNQQNPDFERSNSENISLKEELQSTLEKLNSLKMVKSENTSLKERMNSIQQELNLLQMVNNENSSLKRDLQSTSEELNSLQKTNSLLLDQIKTMTVQLDSKNHQPNRKLNNTSEDHYQRIQQQGFSERISQLTAENLTLQEHIDKLKHDLQDEKESVEILKIQIEVYQSDFNAEREAREKIAGEKEEIAENLRDLQQRNEKILGEMARLKSGNN